MKKPIKVKPEIFITFTCLQCGQSDTQSCPAEKINQVRFVCSFCKMPYAFKKNTLEPLETMNLSDIRAWHKKFRAWYLKVVEPLTSKGKSQTLKIERRNKRLQA